MARRPISFSFAGDASGLGRAADEASADLRQVARTARTTEGSLASLDRQRVDLDINTRALDMLAEKLRAQRLALINDLEVNVDVDAGEALRDLNRLDRQIRQVDGRRAKVDVDVDRDRLGGKLGSSLLAGLADGMTTAAAAAKSNPYVAAGAAALAVSVGTVVAASVAPTLMAAGAAKGLHGLMEEWDVLSKSGRKVNIVFGDQADAIRDWADALSSDIGMGKRQVEQVAAGVQDLLVPKGFTRAKAAEMTRTIVERGAALAEFSGRDVAEGIDAVNAALMGQTRSLKGFGVEINATSIKQWVKDNASSLKGLDEEQKKVLATLALIEAKSTDAWTAFSDGGTATDGVLDNLNSTFANLKTDAIEGFGGILEEVLRDIQNLGAEFGLPSFDDGGLATWILENKAAIKEFFFNLALWMLDAASGTLAFAEAALGMVPAIIDGADAINTLAGAIVLASAPMLLLTGMFGPMMEAIMLNDHAIDGLKTGFKEFGPQAKDALQGAQAKVDGLRDAIDKVNQTRPKITVQVDEESFTMTAQRLRDLAQTRYVYYNPQTGNYSAGGNRGTPPQQPQTQQQQRRAAVNVYVQDERLADLVAVTVDGRFAQARRSDEYRWGVI